MSKSIEISNKHDDVKVSLVEAINEELKRVNRIFNREDSDVLEPMGWEDFVDKEITEIRPDGTVIIEGEEQSISSLIFNFTITINEGIAILEGLEGL